jgi:hypothetical protein
MFPIANGPAGSDGDAAIADRRSQRLLTTTLEGFDMGYGNKTYVIFDGDNDMWAYAFMKGWKQNEHVDFDFHDAHALNKLMDWSSENTVKGKLRERFASTKQAIVLIGENTKNLYKYVRWELETCLKLDLPIVAVNLNNKRQMDDDRCPPILKGKPVVHVAFKMKIIRHALDEFCEEYGSAYKGVMTDIYYPDPVYAAKGAN